jgi:hypothetical protein
MGGHMHGGARNLTVSQPACGERTVYTAQPTYATDDETLYAVTPLLHEPDPKHISWSQSATGWSAPRGSRLQVTAAYDAEPPHMRVMGIAHVYVARDPAAPQDPCAAPPADAFSLDAPFAGRTDPPPADLTLATLGHDGVARPIDRLPGRVLRRARDARVRANRFAFSRPNLSIPRGSRITWSFGGATRHDATLARGPAGFASPSSSRGDRWVAPLRRARRVPHLLLAAPGVHVAVRAGALTLSLDPPILAARIGGFRLRSQASAAAAARRRPSTARRRSPARGRRPRPRPARGARP